jgi:glucose-6-phosphate 1-dehydrogenase
MNMESAAHPSPDIASLALKPCTLVILGGSSDLAHRKLLPALYNLGFDQGLPSRCAIVGLARREMDDTGFRSFAADGVEKFSRRTLDPARWAEFEQNLFYVSGMLDDPEAYLRLRERCEQIERDRGIPPNRVFYLAVPPSSFEACIKGIASAGLALPESSGVFSRIIVEKPVGKDLESAREVNRVLAEVFDERQIFRIDHYLGKETVQNILVMRFGNSIFEPLWNQKHIDHVQITVAEQEGVGTRAGYFEQAGALRDMVQNHMLQLVCLTAMEPPWSLDPDVVRDAKLEVLRALRPIDAREVEQCVVRAQYGPGRVEGEDAPGYRREDGVSPDSTTETFVALKLFIDNWRWAGVPFYLRTGKRLPERASEIAIQFKEVPQILFNTNPLRPLVPNVLAVHVQPEEGVTFEISSKLPGPRVRIAPVELDFRYGATFGRVSPEAYERLLLDVMDGDATLFMRRDAIEQSWAWVTPILKAWAQSKTHWLPEYRAGSWGPPEANKLIELDGREWRVP